MCNRHRSRKVLQGLKTKGCWLWMWSWTMESYLQFCHWHHWVHNQILLGATSLSWNDSSVIFWEGEHIQKHEVTRKLTRMKEFPFSLNWKWKFYSIFLVSVWYITAMKRVALIVTAYILFLLYEDCYVSFGRWK